MKLDLSTILDRVLKRKSPPVVKNLTDVNKQIERPFRAELFSADQMEEHGRTLAHEHRLSDRHAPDKLLGRLAENEIVIKDACDLILEAINSERQITPAAEWLVDNFYLIEEQIRTARRHLPKGYSRGLPCLLKGNTPSFPRVYEIALQTISHGDGRVDPENLTRFISAYQEITPLTLGELWAIPIMLRLALIENLRRVARKISISSHNRSLADHWADEMLAVADKNPTDLILVISDMARSSPPLEGSFVAELSRRLQGHGPALALPLTWIEQRLSQSGMTIERLIHNEIQEQTAEQVSVSNSIGSLRFLGMMDWQKFVENMSFVEKTLRQDPANVYELMDFETRDGYRHSVEKIAKNSTFSENEVAQKALQLAKGSKTSEEGDRRKEHIGYYLIGNGLLGLEKQLSADLEPMDKLRKAASQSPLILYLGSIGIISAAIAYVLIGQAHEQGIYEWMLGVLIIASLLGASHLAVALVNWHATILAKPKPLPSLDFSKGIPAEFKTIVVIPTLLNSESGIDDLAEALEVRYLANRCDNLYFALLTDFTDSKFETLPSDEALMTKAQHAIERLNDKYVTADEDIFFLFHRPRVWNATENAWIGSERKRGKLGDLNQFLQFGHSDKFIRTAGRTENLKNLKYVITLDTDTQLPRDAARQFVGAMAHPLNRPFFDKDLGRVTEGYGLIQPRVAASLPGADMSLYGQMSGGEPGIDPYTRTVSDVYQDAFYEGSFIGKGIYDIRMFEATLHGKFPANRILSHDLLEGCYVRSGLLSDVQLYEEYPSHYSADVSRRHRWIRGDWQIAGWILPKVPGPDGKRFKNPLSALSRWKIFDNLRRSMVPLALILLLGIGWLASHLPTFWTLAVVSILIIPSIFSCLLDFARKSKDVSPKQHLELTLIAARRHLSYSAFSFMTLPYEAYYNCDATLRAVWRMLISKKKLLEWSPSSETGKLKSDDLISSYLLMWAVPAFSVIATLALGVYRPENLPSVVPVLLLWLFSPAIVWKISQPANNKEEQLTPQQNNYLRSLARKTWSFFDTYVGPADNWLPPDNMQEEPVRVVAHRTSPTNIGLSLLANLTAYDFGYISLLKVVSRTENALHTMAKMERYEGHFYNWYDTQSLEPLNPRYVSTVDSGNLAGHLLTMRAGLSALKNVPVINPRMFDGLLDTFSLFMNSIDKSLRNDVRGVEEYLTETIRIKPITLNDNFFRLESVIQKVTDIGESYQTTFSPEAVWWYEALVNQCVDMHQEIISFLPWLKLPDTQSKLLRNPFLNTIPTLGAVTEIFKNPEAETFISGITADDRLWLNQCQNMQAKSESATNDLIERLDRAAKAITPLAEMNFNFLYNEDNDLFSIGYNVSDRRRDASYYDLLASEARLATFVAISQGQIPQESWFTLGRQLTRIGGDPVLLSWSGSMFEFLMPLLVMPNFEKTLLDQTYKSSVKSQIDYGAKRGVPWGVSESGYHLFDAHLNYQYRAFGVPGLGIKRGLADDLVIAPYATVMALMVSPHEASQNLTRLSAEGFEGRFGLYEAVDYTPARLPRGKSHAVIKSFMAHHQGMSFLSLSYNLLNKPMQKRFESEPLFQASMLLLHEKIPKAHAAYPNHGELSAIQEKDPKNPGSAVRMFSSPHSSIPEVHLLSNGRYHVMTTTAGGSYSRWKDLSITRWREDSTRDNWGTFCYVRDLSTGEFWSSTYQPTLKKAKSYDVVFSEGRTEYRRRDGDIETYTEVVVSPEDDIELRRMKISNKSRARKTIEITSYAEVVLAPHAADASHPAFSNLFVQTEILPPRHAILCTRRSRSAEEHPTSMFHLMVVHGAESEAVSYETDRMKFIGRANTTVSPAAMHTDGPLSGSQGSVLDPIVSVRHKIILEPEQTITVNIVTGISEDREAALNLISKYHDSHAADRVFELAWTHSQVILRQLNATEGDAQIYGRLANNIIYPNAALRAETGTLLKNRRGQSGLWSYAISGDLPIVLLQIEDIANMELVRQMVQAHAYWRLKGLAVDLVIWNEDHAGYRQLLQDEIVGMIAAGIEASVMDRPGGIFVRPGDQIAPEDRILLETVARVIIIDRKGSLSEQVTRPLIKDVAIPKLQPTQLPRTDLADTVSWPVDTLTYYNGYGGFVADGREYVINHKAGAQTPAPWVNVLANPEFGTVISENGQSYTWNENAHEYRLTPWNNDPVSDTSGEVFYIRDDETGKFWSPTPRPVESEEPYITRHGFGYSVFEHRQNGIYSELWIYVALDASIKFSILKVRNNSGRPRKISVTGYVEWVLGDMRSKSSMHVTTEIDSATGAVFARNTYNAEFSDRICFFDVDDVHKTITGDRREFIGRNGSLKHPAAMDRLHLSGRVGAGLDPCAAIQVPVELEDGQEHEVIFKLGVAGRRISEAENLVKRFHGSHAAKNVLTQVSRYWRETLNVIQVKTPDPSINILTNGWLMYQTIACRFWARSGYYQSGGAVGFRDQLQDGMALIYTKPNLLRNHLVLCAGHQFIEGDVQHWWHPPSDRGVRTKCSDDYLWLPLAVSRYVEITGDKSVLDEVAPYLEGRLLGGHEDSYYDLPGRSAENGSLYDHCVRAIRRGLRYGTHGLPLIGSCDWNDGMDKVGEQGKGESIWLAFFLYDVLLKFTSIARLKDDSDFALLCEHEAKLLRENISKNGWDGEWYRRAYFDDGTPLGSASNDECKIDSISQSWSVLSGAGEADKSRQGMKMLDTHLVRREDKLIQLLNPPFDKSIMNPGYIRGYVPGVRENGGQYTHAAIWAAMAFAKLDDREKAWELLNIINPINHGRTPEEVAIYKVEPYVVAADVYGVKPHIGRGGWTWYTGSSGWMYRLILESILGFRIENDQLFITPRIPQMWDQYTIAYRYHTTTYKITVIQESSDRDASVIKLDGQILDTMYVKLIDDQKPHDIEIRGGISKKMPSKIEE